MTENIDISNILLAYWPLDEETLEFKDIYLSTSQYDLHMWNYQQVNVYKLEDKNCQVHSFLMLYTNHMLYLRALHNT